jgi:hypothetical protein
MTDKVETKDAILPDDSVYTLSSGDTLTVLPLTWGKEIKVCKLVAGFFSESQMLSAINSISNLKEGNEDDSLESIAEMIIPLINQAPDAITEIVALITGKDTKFVEESLTSEDVMQVFIPFLKKLFSKYMLMFQAQK